MKHLSEFWRSTLRYTLATFIGIVLTFGTAFAQQRYEQKKTKRTTAVMVVHSLSYFGASIETHIKELEKRDSLNQIVWNDWETDKRLPEDTLRLFTNSLLHRDFRGENNTAESVFRSNIETWINIGNGEFIELVGRCFAARHIINQICEEMEEEKRQLWYTYMKTMYYTDSPAQSVQEVVDRVFRSPELRCFILKQNTQYIPVLKIVLMAMGEQIERIKQLMHISNEELSQFGLNTQKEYILDPTLSDDSE